MTTVAAPEQNKDTDLTLPASLPARVVIAAPNDGSPAVLLATQSRLALRDHLIRAGIDPQACAMGTATLEGAEFQVDWDRQIHVGVTHG